MGYNDFGDFYYAHGQLPEAFKSYVRTRDYCTTSKHIVHMCLNAILVSIEMGQFTHVTSYVSKAEQSQELDSVTSAKLRCAAGLAHLESKKYKLAARKVCHPSDGFPPIYCFMFAFYIYNEVFVKNNKMFPC